MKNVVPEAGVDAVAREAAAAANGAYADPSYNPYDRED
jgi:hypothetical protein